MKLDEYRKTLEQEPLERVLPQYVEAEDLSESRFMHHGEWFARPNCWGVVRKGGKYTFFITADDEKGYLWYTEEQDNEDCLVEHIKKKFDIRMAAAAHPSTDADMMRRFIQRTYEYSENQAANAVAQFAKYDDIFDEFRNFQRYGRMEQERGNKAAEQGYTAEKLLETYHLTELEAYLWLIRLRENPSTALNDLGLQRRQ